MSVTQQIDTMIATLDALKADAEKHDKGQKAAGTRVRKVMQEIKAAAQEIRAQMLEIRSEDN